MPLSNSQLAMLKANAATHSQFQLAEMLGVSQGAVARAVAKHKLTTKGGRQPARHVKSTTALAAPTPGLPDVAAKPKTAFFGFNPPPADINRRRQFNAHENARLRREEKEAATLDETAESPAPNILDRICAYPVPVKGDQYCTRLKKENTDFCPEHQPKTRLPSGNGR